jgi:hypothetical protein
MLPARLTSLSVQLSECSHPARAQQLLIGALSHHHQLKQLTLYFNDDSSGANLSPLQRLPSLTKLTLIGCQLSSAHVKTLASLSLLQTLSVSGIKAGQQSWTVGHLAMLVTPAHCRLVSLTELELDDHEVSAAHMTALQQLPALATL